MTSAFSAMKCAFLSTPLFPNDPQVAYHRRKAASSCIIDEPFTDVRTKVEHCECTANDFEWCAVTTCHLR